MIKISGEITTEDEIINGYPPDSLVVKIIDKLSLSNKIYEYDSLNQLKFEVNLRISIVRAAKELDRNDVEFKIFRKARCNADYWNLTNEGGFLLKEGVKPSYAIRDIFINSSKYGTECSTAIMILYYKALLDILPEELFNEMFPSIHLLNWHYINRNLYLEQYRDSLDFFPGDCRYFKNPDVNPLTPEWQGENVIDLGNGVYFGHGIGIKTAEGIIKSLNKNRKSGATEEAYLLDIVKRLNSKQLADKYFDFISKMEMQRLKKVYR